MEDFYFAKGSKKFEECCSSEKYTIISFLKEELNLNSKRINSKPINFRNKVQIFALRLKTYLFDNPGVVYNW